jgi:hypothetical protein
MAEIRLTDGQVALVDDEDFERVSQFTWQPIKINGNTHAGTYDIPTPDGRPVLMENLVMHLAEIDKASREN